MVKKTVNKDVQENISKLNLMQQRLQLFGAQRQQMQLQLAEIENALKEIKGQKKVFKMVGGLLVEKSATEMSKTLNSEKKELSENVKNLEKQENLTKKKAEELQAEITKKL